MYMWPVQTRITLGSSKSEFFALALCVAQDSDNLHRNRNSPNKMSHASGKSGPRGYKAFFILNSVEHEIYPANKYQNINYFNIFPAEQNWAWNLSY